jgi:hypothetical protein
LRVRQLLVICLEFTVIFTIRHPLALTNGLDDVNALALSDDDCNGLDDSNVVIHLVGLCDAERVEFSVDDVVSKRLAVRVWLVKHLHRSNYDRVAVLDKDGHCVDDGHVIDNRVGLTDSDCIRLFIDDTIALRDAFAIRVNERNLLRVGDCVAVDVCAPIRQRIIVADALRDRHGHGDGDCDEQSHWLTVAIVLRVAVEPPDSLNAISVGRIVDLLHRIDERSTFAECRPRHALVDCVPQRTRLSIHVRFCIFIEVV